MRLLVGRAHILGLGVQSMDVTSAYLQAELRTELEYYVQLPATVIDYLSYEERQRHFSVTRPVYRLS